MKLYLFYLILQEKKVVDKLKLIDSNKLLIEIFINYKISIY